MKKRLLLLLLCLTLLLTGCAAGTGRLLLEQSDGLLRTALRKAQADSTVQSETTINR